MTPGYFDSPWPCEDGGPTRRALVSGALRAAGVPNPKIAVTAREALAATMVLLREPGEVFLHGHTLGSSITSWVERIDPISLTSLSRSPDLAAGPFWPGGALVHENGDLYVTCGRWCHRLNPDCEVTASVELPQERPYNSLLALPDGNLVMKDQVRDASASSRLVVLEPDGLSMLTGEIECPESVVARLSANGNDLYVVGTESIFRYRWDSTAAHLEFDSTWRGRYLTSDDQSYGWDPVIAGGCVWFMDNGDHRYGGTMRGAGVAGGAVHLIRVPIGDGATGAHESVAISGLAGGAITNPPLFDETRRLAVAFDSANGWLTAWRLVEGDSAAADGRCLELSWETPISVASHMLLYPESGELVVNDHGSEGDDVVILDIETGDELARAATTSPIQSVVFPAPGWGRDIYYCSFARVARISIEEED